MALTEAAKNAMLNELGTLAVQVSLHTADPGTTGANECSGGSPAYARQSISWSPAAGGNLDSANTPVFDVLGPATHGGLWSADGTVFHGGGPLSNPKTDDGQGTYTLQDADVGL